MESLHITDNLVSILRFARDQYSYTISEVEEELEENPSRKFSVVLKALEERKQLKAIVEDLLNRIEK